MVRHLYIRNNGDKWDTREATLIWPWGAPSLTPSDGSPIGMEPRILHSFTLGTVEPRKMFLAVPEAQPWWSRRSMASTSHSSQIPTKLPTTDSNNSSLRWIWWMVWMISTALVAIIMNKTSTVVSTWLRCYSIAATSRTAPEAPSSEIVIRKTKSRMSTLISEN